MDRSALAFMALALVWTCLGCTKQEPPGLTDEAAVAVDAAPKEPATEAAPLPPSSPSAPPGTLEGALQAKNPGFSGQVGVQAEEGQVRVLAINDPAVVDLSPLKGLPLMALDLRSCQVEDLSPLAGMPLHELYLEETRVADLSALKQMPLEKLYLSKTPVTDLGPLTGLPIMELNLVETKVSDLKPLRGTPIQMLWLNRCPVTDIAPLKDLPLASLTLAETQVIDLSPLKNHPTLERLHIAATPVSDLGPLEGLRLKRLIFTPNRIKVGLDVVREMTTLQELDVDFAPDQHKTRSPEEFWQQHAAGAFK